MSAPERYHKVWPCSSETEALKLMDRFTRAARRSPTDREMELGHADFGHLPWGSHEGPSIESMPVRGSAHRVWLVSLYYWTV